jgi:hypothetical protein
VALTEVQTTADGVMANLHAALDDAHALGRLSLDMAELEALLVGAVNAAERAKALAAAAMSDAEHAGMVVRNGGGVRSLTTYVAGKTGGASAAIAPYRTTGLWLDMFPEFASAWAAGVLTDAHVRELKKLDGPRTRSDLVRAQEAFITSAETLCFRDWVDTLGYWLLHADPDGTIPPSREGAYGLTTSTNPNGDVYIKGTLDPISGEALLTAIEYEAGQILDQELEAESSNGAPPMSIRKRLLLGLGRLVVRGAQRPDGSYPVPLINIVMSEKVVEDLIERTLGAPYSLDDSLPLDDTLPLDWNDIDKRCETIRGTPLDPRRLLPVVLIGRLRRQILSPKSRTIDLGHDVRLFPPALKNALLVEARGRCSTSACEAMYMWLVADHISPHSLGGDTALANGGIRCTSENGSKGNDPSL